MNTNALIGLAALIVVVGGGVWFFSTKDANGIPVGAGAETVANGTGTFADFMMRGGTWTCSITVENPEAPTTGTVYIAGDKLRGEFTSYPTALSGQEVASYMVRTDGFFYTWTNLAPQGIKVAAPASATDTGAAGQVINLSAAVQYDCQPWVADESRFELPTNISFMEVPGAVAPTEVPN